MTSKIYRPEGKHPEPYQHDLNPDASKGVNWGLVGPHPEKNEPRTAKDVKELHDLFSEFPDDELERSRSAGRFALGIQSNLYQPARGGRTGIYRGG